MKYIAITILGLVIWIASCSVPTPEQTVQGFKFLASLSEYDFFDGEVAALKPNKQVFPYELNSTLFTDYAHKKRFIYLPEGTSLTYQNDGLPTFPEGAYIIKNFYYFHDETQPALGKRLIETRLLYKSAQAWKVASYIWNEAQKDADLALLGGETEVSWIDKAGKKREVLYTIPDKNDCKSCHKYGGEVMPIGPKVRNLNREVMGNGEPIGQLQLWEQKAWLSALPAEHDSIERLPAWSDATQSLADRARGYLEINCAHCHNPQGPANNTALNLNIDETDPHNLGIMKGPVSAAQGSGDLRYDIVPGEAEASILWFRMNSVETGIAMPEIGRSLIHEEGLALIKDWIDEM
ncbi:MAG: SO2930 family diheme c-type cytochrome [Bacteroidota bacterium]